MLYIGDTHPLEPVRFPSIECPGLTIDTLRAEITTSQYQVSNACDGVLVFSEPFYPGWRVSVDGQHVPVMRANFAFSAVSLKAGEHVVSREYRPFSVILGMITSLLGILYLGIITFNGWIPGITLCRKL